MASRKREPDRQSVSDVVDARWAEGQSHLAGAAVELLLALRAAVCVPIDLAELRDRAAEAGEDLPGAPRAIGGAGWRILRDSIDAAIARLREVARDPANGIRRDTLASIQKALVQELAHLEKGAAGPDVAILAQAFKSVKAIIERQIDLLDAEAKRTSRRAPMQRRARKVTVE